MSEPKMELPNFKNRKVMVIALVLAIIIFIYAFRMKKSKAPADTTSTDLAGSGDSAADTSQPVFQATPTIVQPSGVGSGGVDLTGVTGGQSVSATSTPDTDNLWARRAIPFLQSKGYSLQVATDAIEKYLAGDPLTYTEGQARDAAVAQFGLPPETIPENVVGAPPPIFKPPVKSPPRPPTPRYYTATAATHTANAIAAKNGISVATLEHLNPHIHFPVRAGTRVRVH